MQTSKNLMEEVSKIIRVTKPDMKIFVGDSLAGNDTVNQAREFFQYTKYDGSILTKSDADSKGGAAISIAYLTHKPILYLGIGQGYGDLEEFDHDQFLDSIFKDRVYEKTSKDLTLGGISSIDDIGKKESVIEIPSVEPQSDTAKQATSANDVDKLMETKKLSMSPILEAESKHVKDNQKLIDGQLNHNSEKEKMESNVEMNEPKSKGGAFFNKFFKDNKDKDEKDTDNGKQNTIDNIETKKEKNKKENKTKSESENGKEKDGVVYLTDDDINDLFK
jgi:fused signal recognition particle receptor